MENPYGDAVPFPLAIKVKKCNKIIKMNILGVNISISYLETNTILISYLL